MKADSPLFDPAVRTIASWTSLRTELIWIYEGAIHPLNRNRRTDHLVGYWVWIVKQGSAEVALGRRQLRAGSGQCLVSPRGLLTQRFSDDAKILSIHFTCNWPSGKELFEETHGTVFDVASYPKFQRKAAALAGLVRRLIPPTNDIHFGEQRVGYAGFLAIGRAFSDWLEIFSETLLDQGFSYAPVELVDGRLLHAIQCLRKVSLSQPFPGALLEQECGLGRSQLDRLSVQSFGMTTREFWAQRRLDAAKAYLATASNSIKEVSFLLGFKQASHFSHWFQQRAGCPPEAYRHRERVKVGV